MPTVFSNSLSGLTVFPPAVRSQVMKLARAGRGGPEVPRLQVRGEEAGAAASHFCVGGVRRGGKKYPDRR